MKRIYRISIQNPKSKIQNKLFRLILKNPVNPVIFLLFACVLAGAGVWASACLSGQFASVHFNSGMPDFGTAPRRGIVSFRGELSDRQETTETYEGNYPDTELSEDKDRQASEKRQKARTAKLSAGLEAELAGRWAEARRQYESVVKTDGWTGGLRDRVEILTRLSGDKAPVSPAFGEILQTYFKNVPLENSEKAAEAAANLDKIAANPDADWLRERAAYQAASVMAVNGDNAQAILRYQALLKGYPNGAKRQDALIMLARTALLSEDPKKRDIPAGETALNQLAKEFPKSRYRASIAGLRARILYAQEKYPAAATAYLALRDADSLELTRRRLVGSAKGALDAPLLEMYLERLANAKTWTGYADALVSVDRTRARMSAEASREFAAAVQNDYDLAAAYIYYRLYHTRNQPADLKNLTRLADTFAARAGAAKLPALVRVRLAEVYYQRKMYDRALKWAESVDAANVRDRALFVRGAIKQKLGRKAAALADFNALLARCPDSFLRRAARENVAILDEAAGNRSGALEQYFALNYSLDIAFLLDIRMTPREIETYLAAHRNSPQKDLLAYSLGIRYLSDERWQEAEKWLKQVAPAKYAAYNKTREDSNFLDSKSPAPLDALRELRELYRAVSDAPSDNERAAALYAYASYYSTHGTLLLYNAGLWQGGREYAFQFWQNSRQTSTQDETAIRNHMISREVYSRSRRICLELARRYPASPVAPAAVYRAAAACRRLAAFNTWWTAENKRHNYWDEATSLMNRVADTYPKSPQAEKARKYAAVFQKEKKGLWE